MRLPFQGIAIVAISRQSYSPPVDFNNADIARLSQSKSDKMLCFLEHSALLVCLVLLRQVIRLGDFSAMRPWRLRSWLHAFAISRFNQPHNMGREHPRPSLVPQSRQKRVQPSLEIVPLYPYHR